jgi:hypothetical protein
MLFKVGDRFITPANETLYTIESINGNSVILMCIRDGDVQRTLYGTYDVEFVEKCFRDGTWKSMRMIRREKLIKLMKYE